MDKRHCSRCEALISIDCRIFSLALESYHREGILRNYSEDGAYIELPCAYHRGNILWIRSPTDSSQRPCEASGFCQFVGLVEVKWVRHIENSCPARYGIGVRILP